jgi:hypothetical protein
MCLTAKIMIELKDKSFDKLFSGRKRRYTELANMTVGYARGCGVPGEKVWLGDVAELLKNTIANQPEFLAHLSQRKLAEGSWSMSFAEYILEQVYPQQEL